VCAPKAGPRCRAGGWLAGRPAGKRATGRRTAGVRRSLAFTQLLGLGRVDRKQPDPGAGHLEKEAHCSLRAEGRTWSSSSAGRPARRSARPAGIDRECRLRTSTVSPSMMRGTPSSTAPRAAAACTGWQDSSKASAPAMQPAPARRSSGEAGCGCGAGLRVQGGGWGGWAGVRSHLGGRVPPRRSILGLSILPEAAHWATGRTRSWSSTGPDECAEMGRHRSELVVLCQDKFRQTGFVRIYAQLCATMRLLTYYLVVLMASRQASQKPRSEARPTVPGSMEQNLQKRSFEGRLSAPLNIPFLEQSSHVVRGYLVTAGGLLQRPPW
jgi:hypothetical protein